MSSSNEEQNATVAVADSNPSVPVHCHGCNKPCPQSAFSLNQLTNKTEDSRLCKKCIESESATCQCCSFVKARRDFNEDHWNTMMAILNKIKNKKTVKRKNLTRKFLKGNDDEEDDNEGDAASADDVTPIQTSASCQLPLTRKFILICSACFAKTAACSNPSCEIKEGRFTDFSFLEWTCKFGTNLQNTMLCNRCAQAAERKRNNKMKKKAQQILMHSDDDGYGDDDVEDEE